MWRMLVVLRRNLQNIKKSPRVADESMYGGAGGNSNNNNNGAEMPTFIERTSSRGSWNGFSGICSVVKAPLSLVSCFSEPHINGATTDGVWVSTEFAQISEMNHFMVANMFILANQWPLKSNMHWQLGRNFGAPGRSAVNFEAKLWNHPNRREIVWRGPSFFLKQPRVRKQMVVKKIQKTLFKKGR